MVNNKMQNKNSSIKIQKKKDELDTVSIETDTEELLEQENTLKDMAKQNLENKKLLCEEMNTIENCGSLNIKVLQDIEKIYNQSNKIPARLDSDESIGRLSEVGHKPAMSLTKILKENHEPIVSMIHMQPLLSRLDKVERTTQALLKKIMNLEIDENTENQSIALSYNINDSTDDIIEYTANKSRNNETGSKLSLSHQESKLRKPNDEDSALFQKIYEGLQEGRILNEYLTVKKFRKFFDDYMEKFRSVHDSIKLYQTLLVTHISDTDKLVQKNIDDFVSYKQIVKTALRKISSDIDEYVMKDPEAAGIVQFVKGASCISCAKSVRMKTTHEQRVQPNKGILLPRQSIKAHLTYDLDRVRRLHNSGPSSKNMNLLQTLCNCVQPARRCIGRNTTSQKNAHKITVNEIVRTTPLQRWIQNKSPV